MIENYEAVRRELIAAGFVLPGGHLELNTDKTIRVKTDKDNEPRGWYRLSTTEIRGKTYIIGAYGVWVGADYSKFKILPDKKYDFTREESRAFNDRIAAASAQAKAARQLETERAAQKAAFYWQKLISDGRSGYLERKGVKSYGLRFHPSKDMSVVPVTDHAGKVWGLQLLRGNDRTDKELAKEYWPKGMTKSSHFYQIGLVRDLLIITEGYASAATIHAATGLPVVVAFDAGNLLGVAKAWRKKKPNVKILFAADDDYHNDVNAGIEKAKTAAITVTARYLAPVFSARPDRNNKAAAKQHTDFNDLARVDGQHAVRSQIENFLIDSGWINTPDKVTVNTRTGGKAQLKSRLSVDEGARRYVGTYGFGGKVVFDRQEYRLIHKEDVLNLLPSGGWNELLEHPDWQVVRDSEIGFDPAGNDPNIICNLYGGWPTEPKAGNCDNILDLLRYECSLESNYDEVCNWILDWLAYPIQNPGAKMRSAIVVHGAQGTGKSLFFECIVKIYGEYGRILGQESLEDKFNSDWAEKKLFILAEEILARQDMFHVKNRLKGFITGQTIRVNPKNLAAHNEANHMNIVFLSNERMPLVLENDDRRHLVIWTPPKLPPNFYSELVEEIENGGVEALHHYLLQRDLSHFDVATPPPMTEAKRELITQSASSEERFIAEWMQLEIQNDMGNTYPFCPCLGSDLYALYRKWCERNGEKPRRSQDLIGHCNKRHGWSAGKALHTYRNWQDQTKQTRKLVVPSSTDIVASVAFDPKQQAYCLEQFETKIIWLTKGYFDFADAMQEQKAVTPHG